MPTYEGVVTYVKENRYIVIGGIVIIAIACWFMFSGGIPTNGGSINDVRAELSATRTELDNTKQQLSKSRAIVTELQQTNSDLNREISESRDIIGEIGNANNNIAGETSTGRAINDSSGNLISDSQLILRQVRERGKE